MDTAVTIRRATEYDAPGIHAFVDQLEEKELDFAMFNDIFLENIKDPHKIYLVACDERNECMGFISCHGQMLLHHAGFVAEIQEMFVSPKFRGKGLGSLLIHELNPWLKSNKCVSLEVTPNNRRIKAQNFYLENGFDQSHLKFTKTLEYHEN
jgi:(aminoalkyl)phosphonate N-acetyltransferase